MKNFMSTIARAEAVVAMELFVRGLARWLLSQNAPSRVGP